MSSSSACHMLPLTVMLIATMRCAFDGGVANLRLCSLRAGRGHNALSQENFGLMLSSESTDSE